MNHTHDHADHKPGPAADKPHTDPVCGMKAAANPEKSAEYGGQTYYFCGKGCVAKFKADPGRYLNKPASPAVVTAEMKQAVYTCPMHPEVRQLGPGSCPICGMALEPLEAGTEEDSSELDDMTRRFTVAAVLSVPLLALTMGGLDKALGLNPYAMASVQMLLASPVVLWAGWPLLKRGWASFKTLNLNMFSLIALGVWASYGFSVVSWLFPALLPADFRSHGGMPLYFEAAAVITTLVLLGQVLELRARARTGVAVRALLALAPATAWRLDARGMESEVPLDSVTVGDLLRLKPGGRVPVDGIVTEGQSYVDEAMLTGEPVPVEKTAGAAVSAGTVNQGGSFVMRAGKVGRDTLLAHIVRMVNEAGRSRAPIQKLADKVAAWFVPAVIAIALATFAAWAAWGPDPALSHALVAAVSVLIIACPCALGLATPVSVMVGVGRGAQEGVLIRDAAALETLARVDVLLVDKTGTLTEGRPAVRDIVAAPGFEAAEVLAVAAALEAGSEHPLARAVMAHARAQGVAMPKADNFNAVNGQGVVARVGAQDGKTAALGNALLMRSAGADTSLLDAAAARLRAAGQTAIYLALEGRAAGLIGIADPVKAGTPEAIARLRADGVRVIMLTGDHADTAQAVARALGLDEVHAGVLPADKLARVKALQAQGHVVAMAGDGINDAPALAQADAGIAMGTGTDIAMESARVVLVKGDLRGIARARALSRATLRNIRQNLFFAFVYNFIGVPVAAGALYPAFHVVPDPMLASAAMSLSSVSVIANALRLRGAKL